MLSRDLAGPVDEVQPEMVARASMLAYGLRGMAARLRMNDLFVIQTDLCGTVRARAGAEEGSSGTSVVADGFDCAQGANDVLDDAGKQAYIGDAFVRAYNVNMSEYVMPDYRAYATLNDWFARRIRPELRPIYGASNPDVRRHTRTRTRTRTHEQVPGAGGGGRRQDAGVLQRARYAHVAEGRPGVAGAIARPIGRPGPVLGQRSRDHPSTRAGNARAVVALVVVV